MITPGEMIIVKTAARAVSFDLTRETYIGRAEPAFVIQTLNVNPKTGEFSRWYLVMGGSSSRLWYVPNVCVAMIDDLDRTPSL